MYTMWAHRLIGVSMIALTLGLGINAWKSVSWAYLKNPHLYTAFPVLFAVFFVAVGGVATRSNLRRCKWGTKTALLTKKIHKFFGILLLLAGAAAVAAGIHQYRMNPKHKSDFPLEALHIISYVVVLAFLEYLYQKDLSNEEPFASKHVNAISLEEFNALVSRGRKLVIVDDLVLDVSKFLDNHPGGKFSLERNIGRDVSKFFYGGYALEHSGGMQPHTHSNNARRSLNTLVVATIMSTNSIKRMQIESSTAANQTGTISTVNLISVPNQKADNAYSRLVSDENPLMNIGQIGKHFTVKSTAHPRFNTSEVGHFNSNKAGIKRHYTLAVSMKPTLYQGLINLSKGITNAAD